MCICGHLEIYHNAFCGGCVACECDEFIMEEDQGDEEIPNGTLALESSRKQEETR